MDTNTSLNEAFHYDPYNPLVVKWFENTDLSPDDAIYLAAEAEESTQQLEAAQQRLDECKTALQTLRAQAFPEPYRTTDEFSDDYHFITHSQDLDYYRREHCPDLDPEGAFVLIGDGEILEVWVNENIYWNHSKFERVY